MLKLHAFLNRKPSSLLPPPCQVEAVVELDAVSFETFSRGQWMTSRR